MTDDDDQGMPGHTAARAARLEATSEVLQRAVAAHTAAVLASKGDAHEVVSAGVALLPALEAYTAAQFELTGSGYPLGFVNELLDDDDEEDDGESGERTTGISVLQRYDYELTDLGALLDAGRAAYLRVWADDGPADAEADVDGLGRALYQIAHADGWDALVRTDGLEPVVGVAVVVAQGELGDDPDTLMKALVADEDDVLYSQADIYR